ncbi:Ser/Thr protein phosphatase family protein [Streptococcus pneumoniae]|nr:Ser/Thr protein phosphatase family protein [Streptococcus pneumoniae]
MTALEAVIADAKNQGVSEYWLLGDIFLPGPGANDLVALLKDLPITASVRGNWDDRVLEALDGEYGLEYPKEIQSMRMTQFLMERMDPATIVWLRSLPLLEKKEIDGLRFSISHNLPDKNYGGDLLVENDTEKFDQLLDAETDVAVYGHVHKQLLRYGSQGQQIINFRKVAYDYEAELELAKSKGLPFIEMYEELRRDDNYQGHNLELLASLIEKHGYVEDVKNFFDFL